MFAIKSSKSFQVLPTPPSIEVLTISVGFATPTVYCLAYIPPNASTDNQLEFLDYFKSLNTMSNNLVLLGDFNLNDINWNSLSGQSHFSSEFCDVTYDLNLQQLVEEPTHIAGNILDLVLTNVPEKVSNLTVNTKSPYPIPSDHFIITFDYLTHPNGVDNPPPSNIYNFFKGNYDDICDFIYNTDFTPFYTSEDIEFLWYYLSNIIRSAIEQLIPTVTVNESNQPPWFNSNIRHHIKCLRTLKRKHTAHPTTANLTNLENSQEQLQSKLSAAKSRYESNLVHGYATKNNSKIYKYIRNITKSASIPSTLFQNSSPINCDFEKANLFNNYFYSVFTKPSPSLATGTDYPISLSSIQITEEEVYDILINLDTTKAMGPDGIPPIVLSKCASVLYRPLHYLFCMTLKYGYLPREWKIHKIVPVFKSGDRTQVKNYRPISLLSNTSKVLEKLIYNKIILHVSNKINPAQFGFLQNRSTTQQLLSFLSHVFDTRHQLDVIYLDISKAFDTVSHSHLLTKLLTFDIGGEVWSWFHAYITNRHQYVCINNSNSSLLPVESGVPQGSILGPLLFIMYMNDLPNAVLFSKIFLFADDTKCFKNIRVNSDTHLLQEDVNCLFDWSLTSHLSFHPSKSCHLSFNQKFLTSYTINGATIPSLPTHKDLGVLISNDLEWGPHLDNILAKAYKTLGLIRRSFSQSIHSSVKAKLYTALVRSQLMYCSPIWRPHLMKDINKIEQLQRRASKYILHDFTSDYKTRLIKLQLFPLMYVLEISDIMFFITSIKNPTSSFDISTYVSFSNNCTRSGGLKLNHNPSFNNKHRHFYFNRICRLWNALPIINMDLSTLTIKNQIRSFLWEHFIANFDPNNPHKFHYLCPCSSCVHSIINFNQIQS